MLADAQQQIATRRFTSPASGNALRSYQRILELEPTNPVAIEGIQRIAAYYHDLAKQSLQQGLTEEGLAYINRGLRAAPNSPALLNLRKEARLTKQRTDQQQQQQQQQQLQLQQQQALLAERQRQEAEQRRRQLGAAQEMREPSREPAPERRQPSSWWQRQQQPQPQPQQPSFNESGFNQR
ncbi:MAG: hypothetical protein IPK63_00440 [Candidatus Competibacteraceae bacterium]|nr:hypothetical protein [Candidatus Competibacteraceae bacterium]